MPAGQYLNNLPAEELLGLGSYKKSAHEVEVVEMLEASALLEQKADVNIIGIIPKDMQSVKIGLSNEIKERFDEYISIVLNELDSSGIKYKKNSKEVTLQDIVESYENPTRET